MDEVTKNMVTAQLKAAKTPGALNDALVSAMIAVVDCQCKTGIRVKRQGVVLSASASCSPSRCCAATTAP